MHGESPKFKAFFEFTNGDTLMDRHIRAQHRGFQDKGFYIFPVNAEGLEKKDIADDCTRFCIYFMHESNAQRFAKDMNVEYYPC